MYIIKHIGRYIFFLKKIFEWPKQKQLYYNMILDEIDHIGSNALGIISFISLCMGAVISIQMHNNIKNSILPIHNYYIGHATKMILILEFSPTIISIILAGKIGSFITATIGTMRITEQIDALEIMGINSISFLILPKFIACLLFHPFLIMISIIIGVFGGWIAGQITGGWITYEYMTGIQMQNQYFLYCYCFFKTILFAFIIVTISSYFGYFVKSNSNSLEIDKVSIKSVVWTSIIIILIDVLITQIMLNL